MAGPKTPLPDSIAPQLATLVDRPPSGEEWFHEMKLDGYRLLARLDRGDVRLLTRRGNDWTDHFPQLVKVLGGLGVTQGFLDGEIVAVDARGVPSFQALQEALSAGRGELFYYLFDVLHLAGVDLRESPLRERKKVLASLLNSIALPLRYSAHIEGRGQEFYQQACELGLEGVVSKRADAPYRSGRSRDWLKVKCSMRQEFVVGGYTDPEGTRSSFGALLLGVHEGGRLRYAGRVGTGFTRRTLADVLARLKPLHTSGPPFANPPGGPLGRRAHWVRPELVVEVSFSTWTRDGLVRQASFEGIREDKTPGEVVHEKPAATATAPRPGGAVEIAGVRLTHPDRVLYHEQGITKQTLAEFYRDIAEWILPHLVRRPLSLIRCPKGQGQTCFFQKHANPSTEEYGEALNVIPIRQENGTEPYIYIEALSGLISLVQLGVLEIHPWGSRIDRLEHPDVLTIDLDPGPDVAWEHVIAAARRLSEILQHLRLRSFLKTTGGKGLHVVIPLAPKHSWDDVKDVARGLAEVLVRLAPAEYTTKAAKASRKGKILIDYLRNARGATAIAAYSTRARPGAPVATPLRWDELGPSVRADMYTVENLRRRLAGLKRDPWEGYAESRQSITRAMRRELGLA